jgi:hypothetical protein
VATYLPLLPVQVLSAPDTSGQNSGNYTTAFTSSVLSSLRVPHYELYHASVTNVPGGASAVIGFSPRTIWGFVAPGLGGGAEYHLGGSGWILNPSQEFYFFWNVGSGPAPLVTAWFRYDQDIESNRATVGLR